MIELEGISKVRISLTAQQCVALQSILQTVDYDKAFQYFAASPNEEIDKLIDDFKYLAERLA